MIDIERVAAALRKEAQDALLGLQQRSGCEAMPYAVNPDDMMRARIVHDVLAAIARALGEGTARSNNPREFSPITTGVKHMDDLS